MLCRIVCSVWGDEKCVGECVVGNEGHNPHEGTVNALVIDHRTKYMMSGDACGCILVWKPGMAVVITMLLGRVVYLLNCFKILFFMY